MTRKDFELIAGVFNYWAGRYDLHSKENSIIWQLADLMAIELKAENSRFDRDKFMQKCGIE